MSRTARVVAGVVGAIAGIIGVRALSDATLSTHEPVAPDSRIELVVDARSHGSEPGQTMAEMVEAQVQACRLEVKSDLVEPIEPLGGRRYRALLAPSMDGTDRKQFRGCLEDWLIDHVRLDVVRLTSQ